MLAYLARRTAAAGEARVDVTNSLRNVCSVGVGVGCGGSDGGGGDGGGGEEEEG